MGKITDPKVDFGIDFEPISIKGVEQFTKLEGQEFTLRGWLVKCNPQRFAKTCIVCVHGAGRDRRAFLRHLPILLAIGNSDGNNNDNNDNGVDVLLFDCREHGVSDGFGRGVGIGTREGYDVATVTQHCRKELGYKIVIAMGTSQGASSSIVCAAVHDRTVNGIVAENPFSSRHVLIEEAYGGFLGPVPQQLQFLKTLFLSWMMFVLKWRLDDRGSTVYPHPIDVISSLPCPILLLHGTLDVIVPVGHSKALFERASEPKWLWIAEGGEHTGLQNSHPVEWKDRVVKFVLFVQQRQS